MSSATLSRVLAHLLRQYHGRVDREIAEFLSLRNPHFDLDGKVRKVYFFAYVFYRFEDYSLYVFFHIRTTKLHHISTLVTRKPPGAPGSEMRQGFDGREMRDVVQIDDHDLSSGERKRAPRGRLDAEAPESREADACKFAEEGRYREVVADGNNCLPS